MLNKSLLYCFFTTTLVFSNGISAASAQAQIITDGTTNTQLTSTDNRVTIENGDQANGNLFHSFSEFSVSTGTEAFFNKTADVINIFSRVTGGNISNINGLIRTNGAANLFLINPAGILFGENASLQIGGSFYGSTADSIIFPDGVEFAVSDPVPPLLTVNAPIGLRFRDNPQPIVSFADLLIDTGKTFTFLGGDINLDGSSIIAFETNVELGAVSTAGEIGIRGDGQLTFPTNTSFGDILIQNNSDIVILSEQGEGITVNAGNFTLQDSALSVSISDLNSPEAQGGDININVTNDVYLDGQNSNTIIANDVFGGFGNPGTINIVAGNISLTNGSLIGSRVDGKANSGDINLSARKNIVIDGNKELATSVVVSLVAPSGEGNSGDINITANNLFLTNGGEIISFVFGVGDSGDINLNVQDSITIDGETNFSNVIIPSSIGTQVITGIGNSGDINLISSNLTLSNGGEITADNLGTGNAGNIVIDTNNNISLSGTASDGIPSIISNTVTEGAVGNIVAEETVGNAGSIEIATTNLTLIDGAKIISNTSGIGNGGSIIINARDSIAVAGKDREGFSSIIIASVEEGAVGDAGLIEIETTDLTLANGGQISSSTLGQGNGGSIIINAKDNIFVEGKNPDGLASGIFNTVEKGAVGDAGAIEIDTTDLILANGGQISSSTLGQGNAGTVKIETENLALTDGAQIQSATLGQGNGGRIIINAKDNILVEGKNPDGFGSGIFNTVEEGAVGDAGAIEIDTTDLILANGGQINSNILGQGNAGTVKIETENLTLTDGGIIQSATLGQGNGGSIIINAKDSIAIAGKDREGFSSIIIASAEEGAVGDAGAIEIETTDLKLADSGQIDSSILGQGNAGNVRIKANSVDLDNGQINAFTTSGIGGNIILEISDTLTLENNSVISAQAVNDANGGNIAINAGLILAFPSNGNGNDIIANGERGNGGEIKITAKSVLGISELSTRSGNGTNDIDASSQFGLNGNVIFNVPDTGNLQKTANLSSDLISAEAVASNACSASAGKSGLTIQGRGSIYPKPDLALNAELLFEGEDLINPNVVKSRDQETNPHITSDIEPVKTAQGDIYPAKGLIVQEDGTVILTAYTTNHLPQRFFNNPRNCSSRSATQKPVPEDYQFALF